jgi:hypothetical protein
VSVLTVNAEAGKTIYISAAPNAKRIGLSMLIGPLALIASDKTTARGGHLFIEEVPAEQAATETEGFVRCDCQPVEPAKNPT